MICTGRPNKYFDLLHWLHTLLTVLAAEMTQKEEICKDAHASSTNPVSDLRNLPQVLLRPIPPHERRRGLTKPLLPNPPIQAFTTELTLLAAAPGRQRTETCQGAPYPKEKGLVPG